MILYIRYSAIETNKTAVSCTVIKLLIQSTSSSYVSSSEEGCSLTVHVTTLQACVLQLYSCNTQALLDCVTV